MSVSAACDGEPLSRPKATEVRESGGALQVRVPGAPPYSVPLKLVDHVVAAAGVVCDTATLQRSAAAGVGWILFHPRLAPCFVSPQPSGGNPRRRIAQIRAVSDTPFQCRVQRRLVATKLFLQASFLRRVSELRADVRAGLRNSVSRMENAAAGLRDAHLPPPADAREHLAWLLGVEGAAANAYFAAFTHLFAPSLAFEGRNRRPPRDPVNVCLSLGYTLIHAEAARAAVRACLEPGAGFLHQPEAGRDSLACDLVETERASVDEFVYEIFRDRVLRPEHFLTEPSASRVRCTMGKAGRRAFYEAVEPVLQGARRRLTRRAEHLGRLVERFPA